MNGFPLQLAVNDIKEFCNNVVLVQGKNAMSIVFNAMPLILRIKMNTFILDNQEFKVPDVYL